jgi:histone H3/H4
VRERGPEIKAVAQDIAEQVKSTAKDSASTVAHEAKDAAKSGGRKPNPMV